MGKHTAKELIPLNIAVLTVSDTRTEENDTSGKYLAEALTTAGHQLVEKAIEKDDIYQLRYIVSKWIAQKNVQVVIITGGTGLTGRDNTPQAITPLLEKNIEGFGELFRTLSFEEIGTSTIQSRAVGGLTNGTLVFAIPGSTGACKTAWTGILEQQLDARHGPCNFAMMLGRFTESPDEVACCPTRG